MTKSDCCQIEKKESLTPLYILLVSIFIVSILLSYFFTSNVFMMYLMGVWFLSFGVLKLIDIRSFAKSFAEYDLIAEKWHGYGYIYPFIEIVLGLAYIFNTQMLYMTELNIVALIVALLGIISAYRVVSLGKKVQCACMGTRWNLPMTKVTMMENGAMFLMIAYMLVYPASMMNMGEMIMDSSASHVMSVDESTIMSSEMMMPTSPNEEEAMRDHCKMMPEMAGCEKYR